MNIKVLLTPTLTIVGVYVLIAFVKPDYDTYMQRRAERDQAKAYAEKVTDVVANSGAVTTQASGNKEALDTVVNYLPAVKDEARSLDSLNFLTTQAGLVTLNIILKDAPDLGGSKMPRMPLLQACLCRSASRCGIQTPQRTIVQVG
jgi:hypothetical protein